MNATGSAAERGYRRFLDPQVLARVKRLDLVARFAVEGFMAGLHRSPFHGFSAEFSDHRQYIAGDPLKYLDWKVYAKTDRLYLKRFEEETNVQAYLLLDRSGTMHYGEPIEKWEYARMTAAALAYLLHSQRDAVGMALFDDTIRDWVPARSVSGHIDVLLREMDRHTAEGPTDPTAALHVLAERLRRTGLIILLSDLLLPPSPETASEFAETMVNRWLSVLKHFRHVGHDIIVFHILDPDELSFRFEGPVEFSDLESDSRLVVDTWSVGHVYRERFRAFLEMVERGCREIHVDYHRLLTSDPLDLALSSCLDRRRRLH